MHTYLFRRIDAADLLFLVLAGHPRKFSQRKEIRNPKTRAESIQRKSDATAQQTHQTKTIARPQRAQFNCRKKSLAQSRGLVVGDADGLEELEGAIARRTDGAR